MGEGPAAGHAGGVRSRGPGRGVPRLSHAQGLRVDRLNTLRRLPEPRQAPNLTPPPGNPRFALFDGLRALAALSVFAGHTVTQTLRFAAHRHLFVAAAIVSREGVATFFLISGFLLYRPFVTARRDGRPYSLRDYTFRRVIRIVPAYWVALTTLLALGLLDGITGRNWWVAYAFGQVYSLSTIGAGITQGWTLCVEVTFYAALPLFALLVARLPGRRSGVGLELGLLALIAAASLAFHAHFSGPTQYATASTLPGTAVWFALGMGLALVSVAGAGRRVANLPGVSWSVAAATVALLYVWSVDSHASAAVTAVVTSALYGLAALALLLPATFTGAGAGWPRRILGHRFMAWVGLVSYAFYLYHPAVIGEVGKLFASVSLGLRYVLVALVSLAVSCACAALSYYLLERPLLRARWRPWRVPAAPGARVAPADSAL